MINRIPILILSLFLGLMTACDKDDDNNEEPDENNNSGNGTASISISGDVNQDLGDYATWEITSEQLLRIRLGDEFPKNIVLNYRLESSDVSDLQPGTYKAVSATYTGQPADEIAVQYNGDDTQFPDSGTVTINSVDGNSINGEIDVTISPLNGASSQANGTFTAGPLE